MKDELIRSLAWCVFASLLLTVLSGCVAIPLMAMGNLAYKSGTMTITLQGAGDGLKAFKDAAVKEGGTLPTTSESFARAEFSTVDMKIEAQVSAPGTIVLRGASLSNLGRTYELKDNISDVTERVARDMQAAGFVVKDEKRDRGI